MLSFPCRSVRLRISPGKPGKAGIWLIFPYVLVNQRYNNVYHFVF